MATGNMLLGLARKKLGDVVFYRSEGKQRARVRVRDIKNPRSDKQSMQRMILATAAKMAAAYEPIVNHSFEGVAVGVASTRKFRSLAMQALRAAAAANVAGDTNAPVADFAIKGAPMVGSLAGLPISRGSLAFEKPAFDGTYRLTLPFTPASAAIATQEAYVAELAKLGLVPGDQLTIVLQYINTQVPVATFGNEKNFAQAVRMARVTFVPQIPENFSGALIVEGKFNASLVENVAGVMVAEADEGLLSLSIQNATASIGDAQCGTLIRSQRQPNGSFKYSSADMVANADVFDSNNATEIYPSYMDGAEDIQVGDALYLRNAVAAFE
jgi:hypothetical protein